MKNVTEGRKEQISIKLDDEDLEALKNRAEELRVPHTILARMLIIQGLKDGTQIRELDRAR